jgi:hypothetical protein
LSLPQDAIINPANARAINDKQFGIFFILIYCYRKIILNWLLACRKPTNTSSKSTDNRSLFPICSPKKAETCGNKRTNKV